MAQGSAVYNKKSKILRRLVIGGSDNASVNETALRNVLLQPGADVAAILQNLFGITISSGRCACVDANGNVVKVLMADPDVDTDPDGHTLVLSDVAGVGWTWTRQHGFVAPPGGPINPSKNS